MKALARWRRPYLHLSQETLGLGGRTGLLGAGFCLAHLLDPRGNGWVLAALGVFVAALLEVVLRGSSDRRKARYGVTYAVLAGVALALGALVGASMRFQAPLLFLAMIPTALAVEYGPAPAQFALLVADLLVIGTGFAATGRTAWTQGAWFGLGALVLCLPNLPGAFRSGTIEPFRTDWSRNPFQRGRWRHALRLASAVTVAAWIAHACHLFCGYWIPMTTLLMLRSELTASKVRIRHRFWGTVLGCGLAIPLTMFVRGRWCLPWLAAPLLLLIVISAARHYGAYVVFLTAWVTLLLKLLAPHGLEVEGFRLVDTLLGIGAVVLVLGVFRGLRSVDRWMLRPARRWLCALGPA